MTPEHLAIRAEVVALLIDTDPFAGWRGELTHADGRPYTADEAALTASATGEERAAANQLQRLAADDFAERARRRKRLDQILLSAHFQALNAVIEEVQEQCPEELRPGLGQAPIAATTRWQDQQDMALAAAIRHHILPGLSSELLAEAEEILAHIDGGGQLR